jgi:hypothetical protein
MDIQPCPKCKKPAGYVWHWSKSFDGTGYAECKGCKAKFT